MNHSTIICQLSNIEVVCWGSVATQLRHDGPRRLLELLLIVGSCRIVLVTFESIVQIVRIPSRSTVLLLN